MRSLTSHPSDDVAFAEESVSFAGWTFAHSRGGEARHAVFGQSCVSLCVGSAGVSVWKYGESVLESVPCSCGASSNEECVCARTARTLLLRAPWCCVRTTHVAGTPAAAKVLQPGIHPCAARPADAAWVFQSCPRHAHARTHSGTRRLGDDAVVTPLPSELFVWCICPGDAVALQASVRIHAVRDTSASASPILFGPFTTDAGAHPSSLMPCATCPSLVLHLPFGISTVVQRQAHGGPGDATRVYTHTHTHTHTQASESARTPTGPAPPPMLTSSIDVEAITWGCVKQAVLLALAAVCGREDVRVRQGAGPHLVVHVWMGDETTAGATGPSAQDAEFVLASRMRPGGSLLQSAVLKRLERRRSSSSLSLAGSLTRRASVASAGAAGVTNELWEPSRAPSRESSPATSRRGSIASTNPSPRTVGGSSSAAAATAASLASYRRPSLGAGSDAALARTLRRSSFLAAAPMIPETETLEADEDSTRLLRRVSVVTPLDAPLIPLVVSDTGGTAGVEEDSSPVARRGRGVSEDGSSSVDMTPVPPIATVAEVSRAYVQRIAPALLSARRLLACACLLELGADRWLLRPADCRTATSWLPQAARASSSNGANVADGWTAFSLGSSHSAMQPVCSSGRCAFSSVTQSAASDSCRVSCMLLPASSDTPPADSLPANEHCHMMCVPSEWLPQLQVRIPRIVSMTDRRGRTVNGFAVRVSNGTIGWETQKCRQDVAELAQAVQSLMEDLSAARFARLFEQARATWDHDRCRLVMMHTLALLNAPATCPPPPDHVLAEVPWWCAGTVAGRATAAACGSGAWCWWRPCSCTKEARCSHRMQLPPFPRTGHFYRLQHGYAFATASAALDVGEVHVHTPRRRTPTRASVTRSMRHAAQRMSATVSQSARSLLRGISRRLSSTAAARGAPDLAPISDAVGSAAVSCWPPPRIDSAGKHAVARSVSDRSMLGHRTPMLSGRFSTPPLVLHGALSAAELDAAGHEVEDVESDDDDLFAKLEDAASGSEPSSSPRSLSTRSARSWLSPLHAASSFRARSPEQKAPSQRSFLSPAHVIASSRSLRPAGAVDPSHTASPVNVTRPLLETAGEDALPSQTSRAQPGTIAFMQLRRLKFERWVQQLVSHCAVAGQLPLLHFLGMLTAPAPSAPVMPVPRPLTASDAVVNAGMTRIHISRLADIVQPGDVLLFRSRDPAAPLRRWAGGAGYDHIGIVIDSAWRDLLQGALVLPPASMPHSIQPFMPATAAALHARLPAKLRDTSRSASAATTPSAHIASLQLLEATVHGVHAYPLVSRLVEYAQFHADAVVLRRLLLPNEEPVPVPAHLFPCSATCVLLQRPGAVAASRQLHSTSGCLACSASGRRRRTLDIILGELAQDANGRSYALALPRLLMRTDPRKTRAWASAVWASTVATRSVRDYAQGGGDSADSLLSGDPLLHTTQLRAATARTYFCSQLLAAAFIRAGLLPSRALPPALTLTATKCGDAADSCSYWPHDFVAGGLVDALLPPQFRLSAHIDVDCTVLPLQSAIVRVRRRDAVMSQATAV